MKYKSLDSELNYNLERLMEFLPRRYHRLINLTLDQYEGSPEDMEHIILSLGRAIHGNEGDYIPNVLTEAGVHRNLGRVEIAGELESFANVLNDIEGTRGFVRLMRKRQKAQTSLVEGGK